jgi:hypothetical protein
MVELYDSGVSQHMLPSGKYFINYCLIPLCTITTTDKHVFYTVGMEDLRIKVPNGKSSTSITLKDVLYCKTPKGLLWFDLNEFGFVMATVGCSYKLLQAGLELATREST